MFNDIFKQINILNIMKHIFSILAISMLVASCTTVYHYQVLETTSDNPKIKTESKQTQYEDENCIITYDMWEENGNPGFIFYNKTDKFITIDLAKSFFVRNGEAFDYYAEEIINQGRTTNSTSGVGIYLGYGISTSNKTSTTASYNSTAIAPSTITIPPKSYKEFLKFEIDRNIFRSCDLTINPKDKSNTLHFDTTNSPLMFSNIITYQVDNEEPVTINNDFYVNSVFNIISLKFYRYETERNCDFRDNPSVSEKYYFMNPRNGFYIKYNSYNYRGTLMN